MYKLNLRILRRHKRGMRFYFGAFEENKNGNCYAGRCKAAIQYLHLERLRLSNAFDLGIVSNITTSILVAHCLYKMNNETISIYIYYNSNNIGGKQRRYLHTKLETRSGFVYETCQAKNQTRNVKQN